MVCEYVCIQKCFYNNSLHAEGAVVYADDKDMKGNPCFKKTKEKPEKAEKVEKFEAVTAPKLKELSLLKTAKETMEI